MKKLLPKTLNNPQGFTLVELLVVIAIIAILAVIGVTVYSGVQKGARDAKRKADVEAIAAAYESHYIQNDTSPYDIPATTWFSSGGYPLDPSTSANYLWNGITTVPTAKRTSYTICAALDNPGTGNSSNVGDGTTFIYAATGNWYCKKSQQQ